MNEGDKVGQRKEDGEAEIKSERQRDTVCKKKRGTGREKSIGHDSLVEAGAQRHRGLGVGNQNSHSHPRPYIPGKHSTAQPLHFLPLQLFAPFLKGPGTTHSTFLSEIF